jgi:TP53 regulating kinase and related kinases
MPPEQKEFSLTIGAEARIELVDWFGRKAIRKIRVPKLYREPELDKILRLRRTKEEVEILHAAKLAGVDTPEVFFADPLTSEIIMEYVEGKLLKDVGTGELPLFARLGEYAAKLHGKGIVHGDLTTKNVIVSGRRLVLIDFGLSFVSDRIEDRAEDLHLLKQALRSSNRSPVASREYNQVLRGYASIAGKTICTTILKQIEEIELRGRYARVD